MNRPITLIENGYSLIRFKCKSGYIDRCICDCINDPNYYKSNLQLNSITEYYRFDNNKWIHKSNFKREFFINMLDERDFFTSNELFNYYYESDI